MTTKQHRRQCKRKVQMHTTHMPSTAYPTKMVIIEWHMVNLEVLHMLEKAYNNTCACEFACVFIFDVRASSSRWAAVSHCIKWMWWNGKLSCRLFATYCTHCVLQLTRFLQFFHDTDTIAVIIIIFNSTSSAGLADHGLFY